MGKTNSNYPKITINLPMTDINVSIYISTPNFSYSIKKSEQTVKSYEFSDFKLNFDKLREWHVSKFQFLQ